VADPEGWGMHPHRHPQCTETGHFEVQNGKQNSGEGHSPLPDPSSRGRGYPSPHPTPLGTWLDLIPHQRFMIVTCRKRQSECQTNRSTFWLSECCQFAGARSADRMFSLCTVLNVIEKQKSNVANDAIYHSKLFLVTFLLTFYGPNKTFEKYIKNVKKRKKWQ